MMASRVSHLIRSPCAKRLLDINNAYCLGQHYRQLNKQSVGNFIARSLSTASSEEPMRRRRRRGGRGAPADNDRIASAGGQRFIPDDPSIDGLADTASAAFAPRDSQGNLLDAQEYLSLASLSPWVPCPDMVIKRVFEIADASSSDVHVDLGCGDGRLNFAAVGGPYHVKKSWGVDVDPNILKKCHERLGRRFVPNVGAGIGKSADENATSSEAERLEFVQADLTRVIERKKGLHQQQLTNYDGPTNRESHSTTGREQSKEDDITQKLDQSTIVTMYFVDDALRQIQPYLASTLGGKKNVRVITVGYEMKGWDASWVERILGLTIFKYDMENVSSEPLEWIVGDEQNGSITLETTNSNGDKEKGPSEVLSDVDESSELAQYIRQKQEQDTEELNKGLRIHHDEKLNDFAQFKSKPSSPPLGGGGSSVQWTYEDWEMEEGGWDFDETEDPQELMKEAHQAIAEAKMGGRPGKGMLAGLDLDKSEGGRKGSGAKVVAKSVWKKP